MPLSSEPTPETTLEIGRLCQAWAFLEHVSEAALCGIIGADERLARIFTWRLDLRSKWQLIVEQAPSKHSPQEVADLKGINKQLVIVTRDRNIVVHGVVNATAAIATNLPPPGTIIHELGATIPFGRVPCWTLFRGAEAGRNFMISHKAVEIVRANIQNLSKRVLRFNATHNYRSVTKLEDVVQSDWPVPIE
jgi:hypothetical protein